MAAIKKLTHEACYGCRGRRLALVAALLVGVVLMHAWWLAAPATPPSLLLVDEQSALATPPSLPLLDEQSAPATPPSLPLLDEQSALATPPSLTTLSSPLVDEQLMPQRGAQNIFLIETSCTVKNASWRGLRARQACAVESAVRHHPGWRVFLLHTCAAPRAGLVLPAGATALHAPVAQFLQGSPAYALVQRGTLAASKFPVVHASDVMRLVALWRYGGLYLDLDVVVLRQLSELGENWAGAEDSSLVNNAILSVSARPGSAGLEVITAYLTSLVEHFDPVNWAGYATIALTRVLVLQCNAKRTEDMVDCRGFRVLPPPLLYPVHYPLWRMYFTEEDANRTLAMLEKAYTAHVWNRLSRDHKTHRHSAYASIARANCPDAYGSANNDF